MLRQVQYIALFILAVEATAWSHVDMDLRHEFGHVLVPRQSTNLQVRFSVKISLCQRRGIADRAEGSSRANSTMEANVRIQTFTEALGGAEAEPITNTGDPERPFQVGDDTFV